MGLLECTRRLGWSLNTVKRYARAATAEQLQRPPRYGAARWSTPTAATCAAGSLPNPVTSGPASAARPALDLLY